tara:strand:+ start:1751 stop:2092 length:342 start_codon:yes stop_codon:yes gene_type:complete
MKDPTIPDPKTRKKFMFYDTEKRQADLRIRLRHDGMNQSHFFRAMITGYLNNDEDIISYLDRYKGENSIQGVNKRSASSRLLKKGEETKKVFGLNENDIEDMFDIIAQEHPDL